nr:hypothetical protein [Bacteroidota bacterium]
MCFIIIVDIHIELILTYCRDHAGKKIIIIVFAIGIVVFNMVCGSLYVYKGI